MALRSLLHDDDFFIDSIKISKTAIVVEWLLIPTVILFFFLTTCLPVIIKNLASSAVKSLIAESLGVERLSFFDIVRNIWRVVLPSVPSWVITLIKVPLWILFIMWLGFTGVRTYLHFGYEIVIAENRILASAKGETLNCEWQNVKNVFIEQSVWGKLFCYGSVTIQGDRQTITVKHVAKPYLVKDYFNYYTDTF